MLSQSQISILLPCCSPTVLLIIHRFVSGARRWDAITSWAEAEAKFQWTVGSPHRRALMAERGGCYCLKGVVMQDVGHLKRRAASSAGPGWWILVLRLYFRSSLRRRCLNAASTILHILHLVPHFLPPSESCKVSIPSPWRCRATARSMFARAVGALVCLWSCSLLLFSEQKWFHAASPNVCYRLQFFIYVLSHSLTCQFSLFAAVQWVSSFS